jgi:hypothetical protein
LKKIIMPSPVKRYGVPSAARMHRPISAWYSRHPHHLFRLGGLREAVKPALVEKRPP